MNKKNPKQTKQNIKTPLSQKLTTKKHPTHHHPNHKQSNGLTTQSTTFQLYIIQLLTGDGGNIWYVGPEDKMLPEAEGRGQHFFWRSNISYVALITSQ